MNICRFSGINTTIILSVLVISGLWFSSNIWLQLGSLSGTFGALLHILGFRIFYVRKNGQFLGIKPYVISKGEYSFCAFLQYMCIHPNVITPCLRSLEKLIFKNGTSAWLFLIPFSKHTWVLVPCYTSRQKALFRRGTWNKPLFACVVDARGRIEWFSNRLLQWLMVNSSTLYQKPFSELFKLKVPRWEDIKKRSIVTLRGGGGEAKQARIEMDPHYQEHGCRLFYFFPCEYVRCCDNDEVFLNTLPCASAIIDTHGTIHTVNHDFEHTLSVRSGDIKQHLSSASKTTLFTELQNSRRREKNSLIFALEWIKAEKKHVLESIFAFLKPFSSYDEQTLFILMLMPAPNFIPSQEQHSQRMELLGQVASGIVHDFNNLLTGMIGFCDLLLQRHKPEDPSFQDLQQIKHSAVRASRLIQHLLDFSKAIPNTESVFSLQGCVQNLMPLIQRMIGPKIFLSFYHSTESSNVFGNVDVIEQMILNLSINARDAMPNGGSLNFVLKNFLTSHSFSLTQGELEPGNYLCLDVKDTGAGIASHILSRIFDPFVSSKEHGTGLGLANISKTVKEFKGGIQVQTAEQQGTTFSIYLPLHDGEVMRQKHKVSSSVVEERGAGKKILLVEDEDPIRLFSSRVLKEKGYEVLEARDGIQAMQIMQTQNDIALIITDVMMPGIDGPALISEVHKMTPNVKALFVSGYPRESIETCLPKHITKRYFLQKPFSLTDLVAKIQEVLK